MSDWKCPIDDLDEDIRDVVRVLFKNDMKPYMSCSGSYKDHEGSNYYPDSACVYMLDSPLARELMACLIDDKRFKCSISKQNATTFYDNTLPEGLRFKIGFENINGSNSQELLGILQEVVKGRNAPKQNIEKINTVCDILDGFSIPNMHEQEIAFSFNDELAKSNSSIEDNFSIEIRDSKDFKGFNDAYGTALDSFIQDDYSCKFLSSDFITFLAFLKKLQFEYKNIPYIHRAQHPVHINDTGRTNRFMAQFQQKWEEAKQQLEEERNASLFESTPVDFSSFFDL